MKFDLVKKNNFLDKKSTNFYINLFFCLSFLLIVFNFQFEILGFEIFASFAYSTLWASFGLFILLLKKRKNIDKVSLILIAFTSVCILFISISQFFWNDVECCKENKYELYIKLYSFFVIFLYTHFLIKRKIISFQIFKKIIVWMTIISMLRYYSEFYGLILDLNVHENRPYPSWIGGWNSYGFILGIAFIFVLDVKKIAKPLRFILLILLLFTILSTLSRGGAVLLLLVLIYRKLALNHYKVADLKVILYFSSLILLLFILYPHHFQVFYERFVNSFLISQYENVGLLQSITSGRSVLWLSTFKKIFLNDNFYQILIGYGPGHFFWNTPTGFETEPHNQYLLFLYEYGIFIFSIIISYFILSYRKIKWTNTDIGTLKTIYLYLLLTFLVEGLVYQTQLILITSMIFAFVVNYKSISTNKEV